MKERRKVTRKDLMSYTQVFDLYGGALLGYLADLTESGAMLIGEKSVQPGAMVTLKLEIPELEGVSTHNMILEARVVWCQPDISPEFKNIGLEFRRTTPEYQAIIQAIIERYEFTHEAPRYPLRPIVKRS